jgi:hypothetical protein
MKKILVIFLLFVSFNVFAKTEIARFIYEYRDYGNKFEWKDELKKNGVSSYSAFEIELHATWIVTTDLMVKVYDENGDYTESLSNYFKDRLLYYKEDWSKYTSSFEMTENGFIDYRYYNPSSGKRYLLPIATFTDKTSEAYYGYEFINLIKPLSHQYNKRFFIEENFDWDEEEYNWNAEGYNGLPYYTMTGTVILYME